MAFRQILARQFADTNKPLFQNLEQHLDLFRTQQLSQIGPQYVPVQQLFETNKRPFQSLLNRIDHFDIPNLSQIVLERLLARPLADIQ